MRCFKKKCQCVLRQFGFRYFNMNFNENLYLKVQVFEWTILLSFATNMATQVIYLGRITLCIVIPI